MFVLILNKKKKKKKKKKKRTEQNKYVYDKIMIFNIYFYFIPVILFMRIK